MLDHMTQVTTYRMVDKVALHDDYQPSWAVEHTDTNAKKTK